MRFGKWATLFLFLPPSMAMCAPLSKGKVAPSFSLPTLNGGKISVRVVKGKLRVTLNYERGEKRFSKSLPAKAVIVDFWATWCPPCQLAMPKLANLHKRFAKKGLVIVGIDIGETSSQAGKTARKLKIPYIIALDRQGKVTAKFGVKSIPTLFLLDSKGVVRFVREGYHPYLEKEISRQLQALGIK